MNISVVLAHYSSLLAVTNGKLSKGNKLQMQVSIYADSL